MIINTKTAKAFRGVLWERSRRHVILRNVSLLLPRGEIQQVDGEVLIGAENVDFMQVVSG